MKKLKILIGVGLVGVVAVGILTVWAGVAAVGYVATETKEVLQSKTAMTYVEQLRTELNQVSHIQPMSCLHRAQTLLAVQPWLERPALENLMNLKVACLASKPTNALEGSSI